MAKVWLDCESVGLCGPVKLIQYAIDDGEVQFIPLLKGWEQVQETRELLNQFFSLCYDPANTLVAYNAVFDIFKILTVAHRLKGLPYDSPERPVEPFSASVLDLYVPATQKSPLAAFAYSKGASRSVAAVRKIPRCVADIVGTRVESVLRPLLPGVVALKRHEREVKGRKDLISIAWTTDGRISLKNLMQTYGLPVLKLAENWPLPEKGTEKPWLPYPDPEVHDPIETVCDMILSDRTLPFWVYSHLDVLFLKVLYEKLGRPEPDHNSSCVHNMAFTKYHGFRYDREVLLATKAAYEKKIRDAQEKLDGIDLNSPTQKLKKLREFDPLIASSSKKIIQVIADSDRPSAPIARAMMDFTAYSQRLNQVEKVLECRTGRCHPELRVLGTKTGRMAGTAGLNWQGIPRVKKGSKIGIRAAMETAAVGDWHALEVILGANIYQDEEMFKDIENKVDPHCKNVSLMQPKALKNGWTYEYVYEKYKNGDEEMSAIRSATKGAGFCLQYFGAAPKLAETLGVSLEQAEKALERYYATYKGFAAYKRELERAVLTADTERWAKDSVKRMRRAIKDEMGFEIRWDLEAQLAELLWQLGGEGIRTGKEGSIVRSQEKGSQTYDGAVKSALLGGAIAIQNAVMRQQGNARVQATGSTLTKMLQSRIWDKFRMPSLNIHDELVFVLHTNFNYAILQAEVEDFVSTWKCKLRGIRFDMKECSRWNEKG